MDVLLIEVPGAREQMPAACDRFAHRVPLLVNMIEGGQTPVSSAADLGQVGFRIGIFPGGTARWVAAACRNTSPHITFNGTQLR